MSGWFYSCTSLGYAFNCRCRYVPRLEVRCEIIPRRLVTQRKRNRELSNSFQVLGVIIRGRTMMNETLHDTGEGGEGAEGAEGAEVRSSTAVVYIVNGS